MTGFDIEKIDDLIHSRLRLGVMAYLSNAETASFGELKIALKASAGNLSVQITKLEQAGYIQVKKRIVGRKPLTTLRLKPKGRKAYHTYLQALSDIVGEFSRS
jgi:DNA-binding MarR family transcriptional regulator